MTTSLALVLAVTVTLLALVACGPNAGESSSGDRPATSVLARLFADADDEKLIMGVWEPLGERANAAGLDALRPEQRVVLLALRAGALVDNGGFDYLLGHDPHLAEETIAAFKEVGAARAVAGLQRALLVFPDGRLPRSVEARSAVIEALTPEARRRYESGEVDCSSFDLDPLVANFLRKHEKAFLDLPDPEDVVLPLETPDSGASDREFAAWIQSIGGEVAFSEHAYESGARRTFYATDPLPSGRLTLREIALPRLRRDVDGLIGRLADWRGANEIDRLSLEGAFYLTATGVARLSGLRGLRSIDLSVAAVDGPGIVALVGCTKLEELSLRGTTVSDAELRKLAALEHLRVLDVTRTAVKGEALTALAGLRSLDLGDQPNLDPGLTFIDSLVNLDKLQFYGGSIAPPAIRRLAGLRQLRDLLLWETGLREHDLKPLINHPSLEELNLSGFRISKEGAKILVTLRGLQDLHIGSPHPDRDAQRLLRATFRDATLEIGE